MKRSKLLEIIKEVLEEMSTTASVGPTAIPAMFAKPGQGDNKATKMMKKTFGYKAAPRPKHPSESGMSSYLQENEAGSTEAPYAFTTKEGLYTHDGVKISENFPS